MRRVAKPLWGNVNVIIEAEAAQGAAPRPWAGREGETYREGLANDLYNRVAQPDTIWWDDLPPELQEG